MKKQGHRLLHQSFRPSCFTWRSYQSLILALSLLAAPAHAQGVITTIVGPNSSLAACRSGLTYRPQSPSDIAFDPQGRLVIAEFEGNRVVRVEPDGQITLLAGNGQQGFAGDGGPAPNAELNAPFYLAYDPQGRLNISDSFNGRVRRIEPDGTITTVVGGGTRIADGSDAHEIYIGRVGGVAFDSLGRLYYADMAGARVRRVELDGRITTLARGPSDVPRGQTPDLQGAGAVALDAAGDVYVSEFGASRVRMIHPDGTITTVVGSGKLGFSGDGGPALDARFDNPWGLAVRPDGLYVVDAANHRVRRVGLDGRVTTIVGGGSPTGWNDGGRADTAGLVGPCCLAFDVAGNLWVNDQRGAIRKVSFGPLASDDLDGDGAITAVDAGLALRFALGLAVPLPIQLQAAVLPADGHFTLRDALRILKRACGIQVARPMQEL